MKKPIILRIVSVTIATQLVLSPTAFAIATPLAPSQYNQNQNQTNVGGMIEGASAIFSSITNQMQQQAAMMAAQNQAAMLKAQMNPENCGSVQAPRPCVSEIFPQCAILNTFPSLAEPAACNGSGDAMEAGQAYGYYAHFLLMEDIYKQRMLTTNNTTNSGVGCLEAQKNNLDLQLKARENEIDNLISKMQKEQDAFKAQTEKDRNTIDESMALLEGDKYKSKRGKAVLEQNSVKFSDAFGNNAACTAVLDGDSFKSTGNAGGFKGIESALSTIANKKEGTGSGSFSAVEFKPATASAIEADLLKISGLIARDIQTRGDTSSFEKNGLKGYRSAYGLHNSPTLDFALAEQIRDLESDRTNILKKTEKFAGTEGASLVRELGNDSVDFEFQLEAWERNYKNSCFVNSKRVKDMLSRKVKIIDPSGSKEANKYADNAYRTFIEATLDRDDISIEEKITLIQEQERKVKGKYVVDVQGSAVEENTMITSADKNSPANYLNAQIENCKKKFESGKNSVGKTPRHVVNEMRKVRSEMMNFRQTMAGRVKAGLVNRVMNCEDASLANASGVATCSAKDLSTSSPSFCVKRANACATNMRQCLDSAATKVKEVTKVRDEALGRYKANVANHEANLRKIYQLTENLSVMDGLKIAANLKQSLVLPTNLKFTIDQDKRRFVQGLEAMEVADPDEYFDLMKKNLNELKKQIALQNRNVMDGPGGVTAHIENIKSNMQNSMQEIASYKQMCQSAFQAFNRGIDQQNQENQRMFMEQQEKVRSYCTKSLALENPTCVYADEFDDIVTAAQEAGDVEGARHYRGFQQTCRSYGADQNTDELSSRSFIRLANRAFGQKENPIRNIADFCATNDFKKERTCIELTEASTSCLDYDSMNAFALRLGRPAIIKEVYTNKCDPDAKGFNATICDNWKKQTISACGATAIDLETAVIDEFGPSLLDEASGNGEITAGLGENRSSMCAAYDTTGKGMIYKAMQGVAGQISNPGMASGY